MDDVVRKELMLKHGHKNAKADQVPFFIWHNVISMGLFFLVAYCLGLFEMMTNTISDLFADYYLPYYGTVFFLMLFVGLISRVIVYFLIMRPWYKKVIKQQLISFSNLNEGVNKVSIGYIISTSINAFFFSVGALYIIQLNILKSSEFYALILAYILMKLLTFSIMKLGRYAFLNAFTGIKL